MHCSSKNFSIIIATAGAIITYANRSPGMASGIILETTGISQKLRAHRHKDMPQASMKYDLQEWAVSALQSPLPGTKHCLNTIIEVPSLIQPCRQALA